jgi:hypothetical protein
VLGRPSRPKDRIQRTKLETPFGHAFDRREVSSSKSAVRACVRPVCDQPSKSVPYSGSGGVGRHERALHDHSFPVASQRFENAMRQPRSIPQPGRLLQHLRMEQDNPSVFDFVAGDCERAVAEGHSNRLMAGLSRMSLSTFCLPRSSADKVSRPVSDGLPATAAASGASRVSGRTATDCGFVARSADLPFRRGRIGPRHSRLGHWTKRALMQI